MRKIFEMTQEQRDVILKASAPVMMIMLQCGTPPSPQENANEAWKNLGDELKFDWKTVERVVGKSDRFFSAELKNGLSR